MEVITFDKGLNAKSQPLVTEEGELVSCLGFKFDAMGILGTRTPKTKVNSTAVSSIHTLHRYQNYILEGDAQNARYKWDLDGFCDRYIPPDGNFTLLGTLNSSNRWKIADCEDFSFWVNGIDSKAFCNASWYEWIIDNPVQAPVGTATTGTLDDTYRLYYTYYIKFPNGRTYETGLSPYSSVVVSTQGIAWSNIGVCPYTGTGVTIHRRLYRTSDSLIDIYYVDTIADNTTTTYTDTATDTTLEGNSVITTEGMGPPPAGMVDVEYYLSRIFGIKDSTMYPSEPYLPFTFDPANSLQVSPEGISLETVVAWGDQLYFATADKWYRLQGATAATWSIRNTFTESGCINKHTAIATRFGILSQWYDGLYVFDGSTNRCITKNKIPTSVFTGMTSPKSAYSSFDGDLYKFHYPSTGTTIDTVLTVDLTNYPQIVFYNDDFIATASHYHFPTGILYEGKADGYHYENGSSETFAVSLQTGDRAGKDISHYKHLEYLHYDVNSGGKDVILTFYVDGVAQSPVVILNTSTRTRDRISLPQFQGYRFSIKLDCADAQNLYIYSPWIVTGTITGD